MSSSRTNRIPLSFHAWLIRFAIWGGAVLVGLSATAFALGSEHADQLFRDLVFAYPLSALIICPAGLVAITWATRRFFPGAQGSGIPQTLAALDAGSKGPLRRSILSLRIAFGKIVMTLVGLLSGASIGREGPTVYIGAAIMFSVGQWLRFPPHYLQRALILGGGAAGIAAAFNTPLAGIVFAIEEISRSFEEQTNGVLLTAVIFAGMTSLALLGNYAYFGNTTAPFRLFEHWWVVVVCGIVGGLLGGLVSRTLVCGSRKLAGLYREHPLRLAAACGLALAILGLLSGNSIYGSGYVEARTIITTGDSGEPGYVVYKILATLTSYLSGIPGGLFSPSLSAGAGLGAELAAVLPHVPAATVILLCMVGYFTGVVQTPITAFVIVMEMTDNHDMLLPLMATAFIADGVSRLICRRPIYRALADAFMAQAAPRETPEPAQEPTPKRPVQ